MNRLQLSVCLSDNPMTAPLKNIRPEGIDWTVSYVHPSEMFWRQLHFGDFDVSEMSLATLYIGWAQGNRDWIALPIFTTRRFFHTSIMVRQGADIASPTDLKGKRVGVPDYQQTSALWSRAALSQDFSVEPHDMHWFMERPVELSHGGATAFQAPPGVKLDYLEPGDTLAAMMRRGELDASFVHLTEPNLIDRTVGAANRDAKVIPLFPDAATEGARYFDKHGQLPINHCVVVRREVARQHPWVVLNLFAAFERAKRDTLTKATDVLKTYQTAGVIDSDLVSTVEQADPLPYGFSSQRHVLQAAAEHLVTQGLMSDVVDISEIFAAQTHSF